MPEARSEGQHPNRRQEMVLLLISGFDWRSAALNSAGISLTQIARI
jgi:hypothetical protein